MKLTVNIYSNGTVVTTDDEGIKIEKYSGDLRILHKISRDRGNKDLPVESRFYTCSYNFVVFEENATDKFKFVSIPSNHVKEFIKWIVKRKLTVHNVLNNE